MSEARMVQCEIRNIFGIRLAEVEFGDDDSVIKVGGENGANKSNFLNAMRWGFSGKSPKGLQVLRRDSERGSVVIKLSGEEFELRRVITEKGAYFKVLDGQGNSIQRPQKVMDKLIGLIGIDPTEFLNLSEDKQVKKLQEALGLDFTDLDEQHKAVFEQRTNVNRRLRDAEGELEGAVDLDTTIPLEEVSAQDLLTEITNISDHNASIDTKERDLNDLRSEVQKEQHEVVELENKLKEMKEELVRKKEQGIALKAELAGMAKIDDQPVREKLQNMEELNASIRAQSNRREIKEKIERHHSEVVRLNSTLDGIKHQRALRFAEANVPVEGLDIVDGQIMFDGKPFIEASDGQRLKVGFEIAAASNPDLKIMFLRHAVFLDNKNRRAISEFAKKRGYLVFMELVGDSGVDLIVEDGVVKVAC